MLPIEVVYYYCLLLLMMIRCCPKPHCQHQDPSLTFSIRSKMISYRIWRYPISTAVGVGCMFQFFTSRISHLSHLQQIPVQVMWIYAQKNRPWSGIRRFGSPKFRRYEAFHDVMVTGWYHLSGWFTVIFSHEKWWGCPTPFKWKLSYIPMLSLCFPYGFVHFFREHPQPPSTRNSVDPGSRSGSGRGTGAGGVLKWGLPQ